MKKSKVTIAAAFATMLMAGAAGKAATIVPENETTVKKEIPAPERKRKGNKEKKGLLEPTLPALNDNYFSNYTSPFYDPTRSQRVKNKLRRKWYK